MYNRLREARKGRHMTQKQLAAQAGVSQTEISTIETYQITPLLDRAMCIADALGLTAYDIFFLDQPRKKR